MTLFAVFGSSRHLVLPLLLFLPVSLVCMPEAVLAAVVFLVVIDLPDLTGRRQMRRAGDSHAGFNT